MTIVYSIIFLALFLGQTVLGQPDPDETGGKPDGEPGGRPGGQPGGPPNDKGPEHIQRMRIGSVNVRSNPCEGKLEVWRESPIDPKERSKTVGFQMHEIQQVDKKGKNIPEGAGKKQQGTGRFHADRCKKLANITDCVIPNSDIQALCISSEFTFRGGSGTVKLMEYIAKEDGNVTQGEEVTEVLKDDAKISFEFSGMVHCCEADESGDDCDECKSVDGKLVGDFFVVSFIVDLPGTSPIPEAVHPRKRKKGKPNSGGRHGPDDQDRPGSQSGRTSSGGQDGPPDRDGPGSGPGKPSSGGQDGPPDRDGPGSESGDPTPNGEGGPQEGAPEPGSNGRDGPQHGPGGESGPPPSGGGGSNRRPPGGGTRPPSRRTREAGEAGGSGPSDADGTPSDGDRPDEDRGPPKDRGMSWDIGDDAFLVLSRKLLLNGNPIDMPGNGSFPRLEKRDNKFLITIRIPVNGNVLWDPSVTAPLYKLDTKGGEDDTNGGRANRYGQFPLPIMFLVFFITFMMF